MQYHQENKKCACNPNSVITVSITVLQIKPKGEKRKWQDQKKPLPKRLQQDLESQGKELHQRSRINQARERQHPEQRRSRKRHRQIHQKRAQLSNVKRYTNNEKTAEIIHNALSLFFRRRHGETEAETEKQELPNTDSAKGTGRGWQKYLWVSPAERPRKMAKQIVR